MAGGVNGKPVRLKIDDDGGGENPTVASGAVERSARHEEGRRDHWATATGTALDLLDTIREQGVLACSGSNSAEELSTASSGGYYFRTAPPDRLQAVALARLLIAGGKRGP